MKIKYQKLHNRALIKVSGDDALTFLQGLITNDINRLKDEGIVYALMLTPKSRFLYDFFFFMHEGSILVDHEAAYTDEIIKKLNMYKMRSKVVVERFDELKMFFLAPSSKSVIARHSNENAAAIQEKAFNSLGCHGLSRPRNDEYDDPRHPELGFRVYAKDAPDGAVEDSDVYVSQIFKYIIPEPHMDMIREKSFPLEFGIQNFNAISLKKGCYIGQELISRTTYTGEIRKKLVVTPLQEGLVLGDEVVLEDGTSGVFCSSYKDEMKVLVRIDR